MNIRFKAFLLCIFALFACQKDEVKISHPTAEETAHIKEIGDSLSVRLKRNLKAELTKAISEKGLAEAIRFCNIEALPLTQQIGDSFSSEVDIKRTSSKYRNPQNAPTEVEMAALKYFEDLSWQGEDLPAFHVQKVEESGKTYFAYYQPLVVGGLCLSCHGNKKNMDDQLKAVLEELYPTDKATGYQEGDFRGVIRINISKSL